MSQQEDQNPPKINKVHTSCKNCVFAEWEDVTQVGCSTGMLDRLEENGVEIIGVYDHEKEFWVINNRKCPYFREQSWADQVDGDLVSKVEKETKLPYQLIITASNKFEELEQTIQSVLDQKLQPVHVTVIKPKGNDIKPHKVSNLISGHDFAWRVQNVLNPLDNEKFRSIEQVLKFTAKPFFGVFNAGYTIPSNLFQTLSEKVIKDSYQFSMVEPDENGNGWIMAKPVYIYWKFHGDPNKNMIENIQDFECQNKINKRMTIQELCRQSSL